MNDEHRIRVLLVDDHQVVRQGLVYFLTSQSGFEIVGQASSGKEALEAVAATSPDVVLMDLVMPEMDGISAIRKIKEDHPSVEILALTSYIDEERITDALAAGAAGYIMKDISPEELAQAIRSAAKGSIYLHPAAAKYLANHLRTPASNDAIIFELTERELEVIRLLARGFSNQEIAEELVISLKTVKGHVSNILQKIGCENRTQAALYAIKNNLI